MSHHHRRRLCVVYFSCSSSVIHWVVIPTTFLPLLNTRSPSADRYSWELLKQGFLEETNKLPCPIQLVKLKSPISIGAAVCYGPNTSLSSPSTVRLTIFSQLAGAGGCAVDSGPRAGLQRECRSSLFQCLTLFTTGCQS